MKQDFLISDNSITPHPQSHQIRTTFKRNYHVWLASILLGYLLLQVILTPHLYLTYQEGINLQVSRLMNLGYRPYTQIFALDPPLFVWFLGRLGQFDLSPTGIKWVFLLFGALLLVNMGVIAQTLAGKRTALAAVFLLATTPTFLAETGRGIIATVPGLALATLSLIFVLRYRTTNKWWWLYLSGAVWAAALFISGFVLSTGLVALAFMVFLKNSIQLKMETNQKQPSLFFTLTIWFGIVLVVLGIGIFLASYELIFDHLFESYTAIRTHLVVNQQENFRMIGRFLGFNIWLSIFAAYGLAQLYEHRNHSLWIFLIWLLLGFARLMFQVTLQFADLGILLPPLAVLAGWGVVSFLDRLSRSNFSRSSARPRAERSRTGRAGSSNLGPLRLKNFCTQNYNSKRLGRFPLATWSLLGICLYFFVAWWQFNSFILKDIENEDYFAQLERRPEIVQLIQQHTQVDDCVVIDDAALAVAANRLPAPQLVGLTRERVAGGLITNKEIAALVEQYHCSAVVFSDRRFTQYLSEFQDWAKAHYPHQQKIFRTTIYYGTK